jgi:hypothetical protein
LKPGIGVVAFLEPIIRDPRVHVVKADIAGKPLEQRRQAKIGGTAERGLGKTPACVRHPLRMLEAVLDLRLNDRSVVAPDSALEEAVSSEPVSGPPISLLAGKLQGISSDSGVQRHILSAKQQQNQGLTGQFPTRFNREFFGGLAGN